MQCVLLTYSRHASTTILFNLDWNDVWVCCSPHGPWQLYQLYSTGSIGSILPVLSALFYSISRLQPFFRPRRRRTKVSSLYITTELTVEHIPDLEPDVPLTAGRICGDGTWSWRTSQLLFWKSDPLIGCRDPRVIRVSCKVMNGSA